MPNILVYDTSCFSGGGGLGVGGWRSSLPLEIVACLAHSLPTKDENVAISLCLIIILVQH